MVLWRPASHRPAALLALAALLAVTAHAAPLEEDISLDELLSSPQQSALPVQTRIERQAERRPDDDEEQPGSPDCAFGSGGRDSLCDYSNPNMSVLMWRSSTGAGANWVGGPPEDADNAKDGGYAFFETSSMPTDEDGANTESAMLYSPEMPSTGAAGKCLKFQYSKAGLSVDRLRVLLHPVSDDERDGSTADHRDDIVIWESDSVDDQGWTPTEKLITSSRDHTIVFEAIPLKGENRNYRGYIAIDSVRLTEGSDCADECTFNADTCTWTQSDGDDFQWTSARGTTNPKTGPMRDHGSSVIGGTAGGYVYIDASHPRRPGDKARLLSRQLPATQSSEPMCFRFWTHMHGSGIGALRVLRMVGDDEKVLWTLSGPSGNRWYQGQVPVTASEQYKIAIEAEVGVDDLGDIAIDDVSLTPGVCPSAPQAAAPDSSDCTFEVDECGWMNPGRREGLDRIDWRRITGRDALAPRTDHTLRSERGYLLQLTYSDPQRPGEFAWLMSPTMEGSERPHCLTFRYYMDATIPSTSGSQVGSIRVLAQYRDEDDDLMTKPLWSVRNSQNVRWSYGQTTVDIRQKHKIIFEGMWGRSAKGAIALDDITFVDGACDQEPEYSMVTEGDCDFTRDSCGWRNSTTDSDEQQRWRLATEDRKPRKLEDHTLHTSEGYTYFDAFNTNKKDAVKLRLTSPPLQPVDSERLLCVSFWYASLSRSATATLSVVSQPVPAEGQEVNPDDEQTLWTLGAEEVDEEVTWRHGEVQMDASRPLRVVFEGRATDFGFALDDISLRRAACRIRPAEADPSRRDEDDDEDNTVRQEV
ncbi:MAM and LDL-receptor class A domain-containing protein 1-like [Amphibalanus amphitrite]|uniref:MAM and LDL-receptor class A domain-containing protein 1-like n=1 Tax=Amphibalanus amphitrite TaxID=1232801 RepID=UPI001C91F87F|nr:MAM and LDL-receptor class A domain-containing protein 1-like [Amphibalanus amphitrite]